MSGRWRGIYGLTAIGLALRVAFALISENIHHPDEIYQYLEPAHRLVFGYGLIPWEFRYGTRSWLIPFLASAPLFLCRLLHVDRPDVYIPAVKCLFCLLSVSLIPSAYVIGRRLASERAGRLAAFFCCFWYELIYFAPRPLSDVVSAYALTAALALFAEGRRPVWFGVLLGLCLALRPQLIPAALVLGSAAALSWDKKRLAAAAVGGLTVLLSAGALDRLTWGGWFASYYQNYLFNGARHVSTLFGASPPGWYLGQFLAASGGLLPLAALAGCFFARLRLPLGCALALIAVHSAIAHKEYRFLFAVIPLLLVMAASAAVPWAHTRRWVYAVAGGFLAVSAAGMENLLPGERAVYFPAPLYARDGRLLAYRFLSTQPGVTAMFDDGIWSRAGGYYYLHRDIPVYFAGFLEAEQTCASHALCRRWEDCAADGLPLARLGDIEVEKRPSAPVRCAAPYDRNLPQPGIDGVYPVTVQSLF